MKKTEVYSPGILAGLKPWAQLVRLPNLFSVPGDPLAGLILATAPGVPTLGAAVGVSCASLLAYAGGLIDNDVIDFRKDSRERPRRPLPSGAVHLKKAASFRYVLLFAPFLPGIALRFPPAWFGLQALLLICILCYNRWKKRFTKTAAILMGLCRSLSLLSGAAAAGLAGLTSAPALIAAGSWLLFVTGLTLFSESETGAAPGRGQYLLPLTPLAMFALVFIPGAQPRVLVAVACAGTLGAVLSLVILLKYKPKGDRTRAQFAVAKLVRTLIPMQACVCAASPAGWLVTPILALFWAASEFSGRSFYGS